MDFDDYQRCARRTVVYPSDARIAYPLLGLVSELGEASGVAKRAIRDGAGLEALVDGRDEARADQLAKELGDVLWYVAALAFDLGRPLSEVARTGLAERSMGSGPAPDLATFARLAGRAAAGPPSAALVQALVMATHAAGQLGVEAVLAEGEPDQATADVMVGVLGSVLVEVATAAWAIGRSLADVAQANLEKLSDRMARGVLQGAGDER